MGKFNKDKSLSKQRRQHKQQNIVKIEPQEKIKKEYIKSQENDIKSNMNINQQTIQIKEEEKKITIKHKKHNRIIIRNLIIDINEKHIKKLIEPYGEILQINIPKDPDRNHSKGFAFVQLAKKNQCLKAINKLNGSMFKGRKIILDLAVAKKDYLTQKFNQKKEEQIQKMESQQISKQQDERSIKEQLISSNQEQINFKIDDQNNKNLQHNKIDKDNKLKFQEDRSSTIFIRNLSASIDDKKLYQNFKKYGKIIYAKVVKYPETGISKQTAFVKFMDFKIAQQLIQYSRTYQMYLLKKLRHFEPNPKINLEIDGKIIQIFETQTKEDLKNKMSLREQQQNGNPDLKRKSVSIKRIKKVQDLLPIDKHNKRNLKLALLGMWKANEDMNEFQYTKFKNHQREKVQKLKNPNHFVSETRIIIKLLDKSITQQQIKSVVYQFLAQKNYKKKLLTYCKLMLDQSMTKSAGYAFLQFQKHQISFQFLQFMQENSNKLMEGHFVCQFAIQDSRKVNKFGKKIKKFSTKSKI